MKTPSVSTVLLAGLSAALLLNAGCSSSPKSVNSVSPAVSTATRQVIVDKRIITDPSLAEGAQIVGLNKATTEAGFLQVQVELLNKTRSMKQFSYRFDWFDTNGMLLSSPSSLYVPRQIEGGENLFITAISPTKDARDFQVRFIENVRYRSF